MTNYKRIKIFEEKTTKPVSKVTVDSVEKVIDTLSVFTPPPSSMILKNRFNIEGEAENNRIVSISADGKILQAIITKEQKFSFNNVIAKPGQNHFIIRSMNEDGTSIILEEIKIFYGKPSFRSLARDFVRGNLQEKKIALTFDGGYLNNATAEILEILKQEEIKATIFLTGIFMRKYPDLVQQMSDDLHEIGNHTWSHLHLTTYEQNKKHITLNNVDQELIQQELLKTSGLYKKITGRDMAPLWRAPYGEHNNEIRTWGALAGFRHIGWTVGKNWDDGMDTMDWVADKSSPSYRSAEEIAHKILSFGNGLKSGANGAVILMHLGSLRTDDYPHHKLSFIIDQLRVQGYQFVTISELF